MEQIYIINGPNLNLLGKRQPKIYGKQSFEDFFSELKLQFDKIQLELFQSNHEGVIIDLLQKIGFDDNIGAVINPAAYTHTSIAIADCISAIDIPIVEVHISDIYQRESFRHHSFITPVVLHSIIGKGLNGYREAVEYLIKMKDLKV